MDCKKGPDSDKPAFAAFVRELRAAFRPKGYLLTSAVSPSKVVIDVGVCQVKFIIKSFGTDIHTVQGDTTVFIASHQHKVRVKIHRCCSDRCSPCSLHTLHVLSIDLYIKSCFPAK